MFLPTSIEKELMAHKRRTTNQDDFVNSIVKRLVEEYQHDTSITESLSDSSHITSNNFDIDLLETDKIYHIDTIKSICIDFRLRFLDTKFFKNELPEVVIEKIKQLENEHDIKIKGFKIMAPSKLFRLENPDDPLLFAPIGNGYYYLIHKWGKDLSPFRKLLVTPFKTLDHLMVSALIVSLVISYVFNSFLTVEDNNFISNFFLIFLFNFKCVIAVIMFYAIPRGKSVNASIWDSAYSK